MRTIAAFLLALIGAAASAQAQSPPATVPYNPSPDRGEIAFGYSYLHTNAPPGGCGCFSMNGFVIQFGYPVNRRGWSGVGDITWETNRNVLNTGTEFHLAAFDAGARYRLIRGGWEPFGEVMAGGIQATGGYASIGITSHGSEHVSFVGVLGGGLDRRLAAHLVLRLVEADYFATTFQNGSNDHQNNLRVTTGVALRF